MNYFKVSVIGLIYMTSCVPVTTNSSSGSGRKMIVYDNHDYEPFVGMVQLFPEGNSPNELENPAIPLHRDSEGFLLRFDLLEANFTYLNARYVHCNADWTPSGLADIRFLDEYNEFSIQDYEYSANTITKYVHYSANLPAPKISGNYLILVYRAGSPQDLLFSRRALVYDQQAVIETAIEASSNVSRRRSHHQIKFSINYGDLPTLNPLNDFLVVLLQNHRWETAITGLQPTLVRPDEHYLEFDHFNMENNFPAINEFRFFDIRTIDYRGLSVASIEKKEDRVDVFLRTDKSRAQLAYTQINDDLNGRYYLENNDPGDTYLQSEYVNVHFELKSEEIEGEVYLMGRYNNWERENRLTYHPTDTSYKTSVLLKQGYYDYLYWTYSDQLDETYFEGNSYQTENEYEILLYYRNPMNGFDELIGYEITLSSY